MSPAARAELDALIVACDAAAASLVGDKPAPEYSDQQKRSHWDRQVCLETAVDDICDVIRRHADLSDHLMLFSLADRFRLVLDLLIAESMLGPKGK